MIQTVSCLGPMVYEILDAILFLIEMYNLAVQYKEVEI